jgi:hypothetical protein
VSLLKRETCSIKTSFWHNLLHYVLQTVSYFFLSSEEALLSLAYSGTRGNLPAMQRNHHWIVFWDILSLKPFFFLKKKSPLFLFPEHRPSFCTFTCAYYCNAYQCHSLSKQPYFHNTIKHKLFHLKKQKHLYVQFVWKIVYSESILRFLNTQTLRQFFVRVPPDVFRSH